MFKIIGVILGFYILGIIGAILGFIMGSIADRLRVYGPEGVNPFNASQRQSVFLETVFTLMGKLAKADGRISEKEISHVEAFMLKLGMSSDHRLKAIDLFKQGAKPDFDIQPAIQQFMAMCGHSQSLKQMLLVYLIVMGLSDGALDTAEERLLKQIASQLGYHDSAFQQLLDMVQNQSHFAPGQATSANALDDAYKALGVTKDSSDQEIKRAYRKLMSQYHPDKLMGQGVPEEMISVATEQAKEVQVAYDLIKKHRGQS